MKKKVLLIRLDKIGDLICTLPVDQVLDESQYDVTWVIQKGLANVIDNGEKKRKYIELNKQDAKHSQELLREFLYQNHFDYAVSFQCPWWVNFELFKSTIKTRIGVLSQWHSFMFLNQGLRQKRSEAKKHEFEYNLDLIEKITGKFNEELKEKIKQQVFFKFKKPVFATVFNKFNLPQNYIVIHPGMMGSALNISQEQYIKLINEYLHADKTVVITGTDADEPYLDLIKKEFDLNEVWQKKVIWLQSKLTFKELIEVINYAEMVIAPSTGVAHIAASLDKKVIGIYSPIRVHHPRRWAPRGNNVTVLLPENIQCPEQFKCAKEKCPHYNCMTKINLDFEKSEKI